MCLTVILPIALKIVLNDIITDEIKIRGHINPLVRVIHEIHVHQSPKNNYDSIVLHQ